MLTDKGFTGSMGRLEAAFGAQEVPRHRLYRERFFNVLDDATFRTACDRCIDELRAFPTIHDLLDRIPGQVSAATEAASAWSRVLNSATNGPTSYCPATGSRPTGADLSEDELAAVGGLSGLQALAESQEDAKAVGFARRDFIDTFKARSECRNAGLLAEPNRPAALPAGDVAAVKAEVDAIRGSLHGTKRLPDYARGR